MYSSNFQNFASTFGGVFNVNSPFSKEIFGSILYAVNEQVAQWEGIKNLHGDSLILNCGYIQNEKQNAIASKYNETYVVAVYKWLAWQLFQLFFGYLSHPKILLEFGDPEKETVKFDWEIQNGMPITRAFKENSLLLPNDPERAKLAWLLYKISLSYVFFHEIGHICCGHADCLRNNYSVDHIEEKVDMKNKKLNDTLSAFEVDADIFSGSYIFSYLKHELYGVFDVKLSNSTSLSTRISLMLFSIGTVLRVFQYISPRRDFFQITTHPAPVVRFYAFITNFLPNLMYENEIKDSDYNSILFNTMKWLVEVDNIFQPPNSVNEWFANVEEIGIFTNKIAGVLEKSYHELFNYEFIPARKLSWQNKNE